MWILTSAKNVGFAALVMLGLLAGCTDKKVAPLTYEQQQAVLDSTVQAKIAEIKRMEAERLRDRMSIEVKVIVDSLEAKRHREHPIQVAAPEQEPADSNMVEISSPIDSSVKSEQ